MKMYTEAQIIELMNRGKTYIKSLLKMHKMYLELNEKALEKLKKETEELEQELQEDRANVKFYEKALKRLEDK